MYLYIRVLFLSGTTQEGPGTVIVLPGQDVELLCNLNFTGGFALWTINRESVYSPNELFIGRLPGYNISLDGRNIIIEDIMMNDDRNGSNYICIIPQAPPTPDIVSDPTILLVAGKCIIRN